MVYVCTSKICEKRDRCMHHRPYKEGINVIYFNPIKSNAEVCPHYITEWDENDD